MITNDNPPIAESAEESSNPPAMSETIATSTEAASPPSPPAATTEPSSTIEEMLLRFAERARSLVAGSRADMSSNQTLGQIASDIIADDPSAESAGVQIQFYLLEFSRLLIITITSSQSDAMGVASAIGVRTVPTSWWSSIAHEMWRSTLSSLPSDTQVSSLNDVLI